jgi:hypothetical protein
MKQSSILSVRSLFALFFFTLISLTVSAQENKESGSETTTSQTSTSKTTDVNITMNDADAWYTQPWVWIVGAAVFILLLVALLGGSRKETVRTSDRVTVKKTVERDGDPTT